jgi:hypothetical protein
VWGWGDDEASARQGAAERLGRVLERLKRGERFPERYAYGNRPLREEILRIVTGDGEQPAAILTRNVYGAQVLNASRLLFLDVDTGDAAGGLGRRLGRWFGRAPAEDEPLATLRAALQRSGLTTFRIYRTASGFRVMAVDRAFDPSRPDVQELMKQTGTDPAFAQLCLAQRSFRARLTPKPWRCGLPVPPGQHPREDPATQARFVAWLAKYERTADGFAACRYLETVGNGVASGDLRTLQELHDRATKCDGTLPLA